MVHTESETLELQDKVAVRKGRGVSLGSELLVLCSVSLLAWAARELLCSFALDSIKKKKTLILKSFFTITSPHSYSTFSFFPISSIWAIKVLIKKINARYFGYYPVPQ